MINKKILASIFGVTLLGSTLFGASYVAAQKTDTATPSIVQRLAEKFNLNQDDVQKVFDEHRQENQKYMQEQLAKRLDQAVKDGKITTAQKDAILKKHSEMVNVKFRNGNFKELTAEEKQKMGQEKRAEMETWANEIGLDLATIHELIGHNGMGKGKMIFKYNR